MPLAYNSERGEVPLTVGGVDLVIAAEMGKLAALSSRVGCQSFADLYTRLIGGEPATTLAAIEIFAVQGDWGAALKAIKIGDLVACRTAFAAALMHHVPGDQRGNGEAAGRSEATTGSPGGNGRNSPTET